MHTSSTQLPEWLKEQYPFHPHYLPLDNNGPRMHYVDEGTGPTVLMVHGNPTWSFFYRHLIKQLRNKYRCIAVDHIGCGLSDKPQNYSYTLQQHIDNLAKLVTHLNLKHFDLVVHDWGGPIGIGMAQRHFDLIRKIAILNTAAFHESKIPWQLKLARTPLLSDLLIRGLNQFAKQATQRTTCKPLPQVVINAYLYPYNSWNNRIATHRFVQDIPVNKKHTSYSTLKTIEEQLPQLATKPLRFFWGQHDFVFTQNIAAQWQQRFPNATFLQYSNAGHYLMEDEPKLIPQAIEVFLNQK
jgi:pimeloyl-ACP methyl ester carboxylesterase